MRVTVKAHEGALLNEHDVDGKNIKYQLHIAKKRVFGGVRLKDAETMQMTIPETGQLSTEMRVIWDDSFKQPHPGVYQDTLTVQVALEN